MSNRYEIITNNIINSASAPADLAVGAIKYSAPGVPGGTSIEDKVDAGINFYNAGIAVLELTKKVPVLAGLGATASLGNNLRKALTEINGTEKRMTASTQLDLLSDFASIASVFAIAAIGTAGATPVWVSLGVLLATAGIASSVYSSVLGVEDKQRAIDLVNSAAYTVATLDKFPEFKWLHSDQDAINDLKKSSPLVYPAVELLHYLSPSLTLQQAQDIINASGSGALFSGGKLGELSATLNGIRRMIGQPPLTIADEDQYLPALEQTFAQTSNQLGNYKLLAWPQTAGDVEALARSNASVRASMVAGLPFMVMQGSVAGVDATQSSLIDPATGQGQLSEQWLRDRALYLSLQSKANSINRPIGPDGVMVIKGETSENLEFIDATTGNKLTAPVGEGIVGALTRISFGSATADLIRGRSDSDRLYGGAGNDTITAGKGNDYIEGNAGDDVLLSGEDGNDVIIGGAGNDKIEGGQNNDILIGGEGIDTLDGGEGSDFLNGGAGKDTLTGGTGNDYLYDQGGTGASEQSTLKGDGGNDILEVKGGSAGITLIGGGADNDIIIGSAGSNSLDGDAGNDIITGADQYDIINGGDGADNIEAGGGADRIDGGKGSDYMKGGAGFDDYIYSDANFGTDLIEDDNGSITAMGANLSGGSFDINRLAYTGGGYEYRQYTLGSFTLLGINRVGDTKNTIYLKDWQYGQLGIYLDGQEQETEKPPSSPISVESLAGNDVDFILGKDAADGGKGNDFLQGTDAQSVLAGGIDNDVLNGMGGNDWLEGGDGNDYIGTGQGSDVAYGGKGNDLMSRLTAAHSYYENHSKETNRHNDQQLKKPLKTGCGQSLRGIHPRRVAIGRYKTLIVCYGGNSNDSKAQY
jgi:Ca2+-binding RTX toxin-like protein